jgi:hypothetical protein
MSKIELEQLMSSGMGRGVASLCNLNTIARAIIDWEEATARIWLRREQEKGWIDYPIGFATQAMVR